MCPACPLSVAAAWRVGNKQAGGAQQGQRRRHGCSGAAAWLGNALGGVGDTAIELFKGALLALCHSGIVPGWALLMSLCMHTGAGNWQFLSSVGQ